MSQSTWKRQKEAGGLTEYHAEIDGGRWEIARTGYHPTYGYGKETRWSAAFIPEGSSIPVNGLGGFNRRTLAEVKKLVERNPRVFAD